MSMTESEIDAFMKMMLETHGLKGWSFRIVEECGITGDAYGYTYTSQKLIVFNRQHIPTCRHNIEELARHEIAHALAGHGDHNEEWEDILHSLGGCYVWLEPWMDAITHEKAHHAPLEILQRKLLTV